MNGSSFRSRNASIRPTVLMTFDPHPMEVVFPGSHPAQLTTLTRRAELVEEMGIVVHACNADDVALDMQQPLVANLVRNPQLTQLLRTPPPREPIEMESPADARRWLQIFLVDYGADQHLLLVQDATRVHRLEQMRRCQMREAQPFQRRGPGR